MTESCPETCTIWNPFKINESYQLNKGLKLVVTEIYLQSYRTNWPKV